MVTDTMRLRPDASALLQRLRASQAWVLVLLLLAGVLLFKPSVVQGNNGEDLLRQCAILGVLTIGEAVVLLGGGIDLSVAANVRISSVVGAMYFARDHSSFLLGAILIMLVSLGMGAVNGLLIGYLRMPAFITTLAALLTVDGVTLSITSSATGAAPDGLINFYTQKIWFVPMPAVVLIAVSAVAAFSLRATIWGKAVYAVGGDATLAGHSGLRVARTTFSLYMVSGGLAGVTALLLLSRSGVGDPLALQGAELTAITAAVIGAVSLAGGRGTIWGALGGVAFLTFVSVLLTQVGVPDRYQILAQGLLILGALATYRGGKASR